jgi:hypothetical protein
MIAAGFATIAASANAGLVIDSLSAAYPSTENVLFNEPSINSMGPLVQGMTNSTKLIVDWYGAGEDLLTENAQVKAVDGSFSMFSVTMNDPGLGIAAYQFNLDALGTGDVMINLYENGSLSYAETFSVSKSGPNTFRVYGTEKEVMSAVSILSTVELSGVSRNRIYALPGSVPEPAAFIVLGVGLAGLLARRRLR